MELMTIESARFTHLYPPDEVHSLKVTSPADSIPLVAQRYEFARIPSLESLKDGAKFQHGRRSVEGKVIPIKELAVYNDGVFCESETTEDARLIIDDFILWIQHAFGVRPQRTHVGRWHFSTLVVEFASEINAALSSLRHTQSAYQAAMKETYGVDAPSLPSRIAFGPDPSNYNPHFQSEFLIERRIGTSYTANRFFCRAQLPTSIHLSLLQDFENEILQATRINRIQS